MATVKSDFGATWYPLIGQDAAEELRRARRTAWLGPLNVVFAGGAGLLIGTSPLGDAIGVALVPNIAAPPGVSQILLVLDGNLISRESPHTST